MAGKETLKSVIKKEKPFTGCNGLYYIPETDKLILLTNRTVKHYMNTQTFEQAEVVLFNIAFDSADHTSTMVCNQKDRTLVLIDDEV